jgi:uncharacterized protein YqhQ
MHYMCVGPISSLISGGCCGNSFAVILVIVAVVVLVRISCVPDDGLNSQGS